MIRRTVAALVAASAVWLTSVAPAIAETPDPNLRQTVSATEAAGKGRVELAKGHVDVGPRLVDGKVKFLARDDTANPPVWRDPADMLIRVRDTAKTQIPADPQYDFLKAKPGSDVYVVPQTQDQQVIWLGWNTQDPAVSQLLDRGAKLVFRGYQGPGAFNVFLQNGFDKPQPLWDGAGASGQEIWVDNNTHTHANWVFTAPGVYLVNVDVVAKTKTGEEIAAPATFRFAVSDAVTMEQAFAVSSSIPAATPVASGAANAAPSNKPGASPSAEAGKGGDAKGLPVGLLAAGAGLALVTVLAVLFAIKTRRAKAAADE